MTDPDLAPLALAGIVLVLASLAEWIHARRVRRIARLAFGPTGKPAPWARPAPTARVLAFTALAWSLLTLALGEPRRYELNGARSRVERDPNHVLLVLDVSPSMRLVDAGPDKKQSRMMRARDLMESFFDRVPMEENRVTVVATYNGAKPVVVDTADVEVIRHILGELPMHWAFPTGKTKLFDGLEEAARIAKPWNPGSTVVILLSDGDTVPATGIPRMPASVRSVLVVGVGDSQVGKFIDGRQSRQDVPTLKQIAARLGGTYHDGNAFQIGTGLIASAMGREEESVFLRLTRREYALIACAAGSMILALLPLLLQAFGTNWRPGASKRATSAQGAGKAQKAPGNQRVPAALG
ncbi:MAG: VWA domain-containing protein [Planctomycetota bacterium]|nr:VWA domain-containing protein [Planctomycetota bacterium]